MTKREFEGNFGEMTLNIDGKKATGTYQKEGTLIGTFENETFEGQWKNKGLEGLVEFIVKDECLNGTWKKGLEPGIMKGKWFGEELI